MDVARINLSHGTHAEHARDIVTIRQIAREEEAVIAVMADLQGPKPRIGMIDPEPIHLVAGDRLTLTTRPASGKANVVNLPHPELIAEAQEGQPVLLDDGAIELRVEQKTFDSLICKVVAGGELRSHKGIAVPRSAPLTEVVSSAVTPKDRKDAIFALNQGVDFLALSFVRSAGDVQELRSLIQEERQDELLPGIVAKIEKKEALSEFDTILEAADAVMVARGDLGVEVPTQEIPLYQKEIIHKCNYVGKPVITATQMLQSMIDHPRPTRAEASDVANAILDGTDAVMLSAETATGRYPLPSVEMIQKIAKSVEGKMPSRLDEVKFEEITHRHPVTDAIGEATRTIARDLNARLVATSTWTGYTARQVARERPKQPIVAFTPNEAICRQLALTWGVIPVLVPPYQSTDEMIQVMEDRILSLGLAKKGELVVVTGGLPVGGGGKTNFVKVHCL
jgi:pyruvate kinase